MIDLKLHTTIAQLEQWITQYRQDHIPDLLYIDEGDIHVKGFYWGKSEIGGNIEYFLSLQAQFVLHNKCYLKNLNSFSEHPVSLSSSDARYYNSEIVDFYITPLPNGRISVVLEHYTKGTTILITRLLTKMLRRWQHERAVVFISEPINVQDLLLVHSLYNNGVAIQRSSSEYEISYVKMLTEMIDCYPQARDIVFAERQPPIRSECMSTMNDPQNLICLDCLDNRQQDGQKESIQLKQVKPRRGGPVPTPDYEKRAIIEAWLAAQGRQSQETFCQTKGISPSTLRKWMREQYR